MLEAEARLTAHVCGDGWLTSYVEKNALQIVHGRRYHRPRKRYVVGYSNSKKELLREFATDLTKIFNISPRFDRPDEVRCRSKRVFDRLQELGAGSSYGWKIGGEITHASTPVKAAWLGAFFDDEATVDVANCRIRIKSMNHAGLAQVKQLLSNCNVLSTTTGPNVDGSRYLTISKDHILKFSKVIGFNHLDKSKKLIECCCLLSKRRATRS